MYPPIKEHRLIYYPNNTIFGELMKSVSENLKLESPVGVNDPSELETIFRKNEAIAALHFHHVPVSKTKWEV